MDYHSLALEAFRKKYAGKFEVTRLSFPNRPIQVPNDLGEILKTLEDYL